MAARGSRTPQHATRRDHARYKPRGRHINTSGNPQRTRTPPPTATPTSIGGLRFRDGYRADLVAVFADQLRDEAPTRVWARTLRDLTVTVPAQHLETRMNRPAPNVVTAGAAAIACTAAVLAFTLGSPPAMVLFFGVAVVATVVALLSWNANQPARPVNASMHAWWKFLVAGVLLAGVTFSAMAIPWPDEMDLGGGAYWLALIGIITSFTLGGVGLLLGIGALIGRGRPRTGAPAA